MLTELNIVNFALIDYLEVNFSKGMTSITGETGAGKSILLGGLALVLGKRADLSTLKDKSKKCYVDATFSIAAYDLKPFFDSVDLDYESITKLSEIIDNEYNRLEQELMHHSDDPEFELGNLYITIINLKTSEKELIVCE